MKGLPIGAHSGSDGFFAIQTKKLIALCLLCVILFLSQQTATAISSFRLRRVDEIPKKIWQSWKVDPTSFEARDAERARTWVTKNPLHRYEVLTDTNAESYLAFHYGPNGFNRPDILATYTALKAKVVKSDLLRYLIMYAEGGIWADIDVEAIRPIRQFIPKRFDERHVDMVIGIETDEPGFLDHPVLGSKAQSFCQWTFACKPHLPIMMRMIEGIMAWLDDLSDQQKKPISDLYFDFDAVLSGTGPSAFTKAILAEMSRTSRKTVTWKEFHDLTEAKLYAGVLVLTAEAFAAGTGHSDSGTHAGRGALIKHHFHASSWPSQHPRFKHPVYGEVEQCNWDAECVKLWDSNTAFFDALPEQDRLKIIALRDKHIIMKEAAVEKQQAINLLPPPPPMNAPPLPAPDANALPDLGIAGGSPGKVTEEPPAIPAGPAVIPPAALPPPPPPPLEKAAAPPKAAGQVPAKAPAKAAAELDEDDHEDETAKDTKSRGDGAGAAQKAAPKKQKAIPPKATPAKKGEKKPTG